MKSFKRYLQEQEDKGEPPVPPVPPAWDPTQISKPHKKLLRRWENDGYTPVDLPEGCPDCPPCSFEGQTSPGGGECVFQQCDENGVNCVWYCNSTGAPGWSVCSNQGTNSTPDVLQEKLRELHEEIKRKLGWYYHIPGIQPPIPPDCSSTGGFDNFDNIDCNNQWKKYIQDLIEYLCGMVSLGDLVIDLDDLQLPQPPSWWPSWIPWPLTWENIHAACNLV